MRVHFPEDLFTYLCFYSFKVPDFVWITIFYPPIDDVVTKNEKINCLSHIISKKAGDVIFGPQIFPVGEPGKVTIVVID